MFFEIGKPVLQTSCTFKQVISLAISGKLYVITSNITEKIYIFYNLDCKSKLVIYRTECTICRIQYINKSETQFNLRLNNHQKDVNRQNAPLVDQHFKLPGGNFNQRAKFILIEQLGSQYKHRLSNT